MPSGSKTRAQPLVRNHQDWQLLDLIQVVNKNPPDRKPLLVVAAVGWSILRAVIVGAVLIDWALFINTTGNSNAVLFFQLFAPGVLLSLSWIVIGIAIYQGKFWSRFGFLIISAIVIFRPGPGFISYPFLPAVYSVSAGLIALWLLNHESVLLHFRAEDFRPTWISKGVFGLSWDLFFGLVLLVSALAIEISLFLTAYAIADRI